MSPLTATDPRITEFLRAWHESERADFERSYSKLVYDDYSAKTAKDRRRFIACDRGNAVNRSGVYLVDKATGEVYSIKAYGVPNRRLGTLEVLTARYTDTTPAGRQPNYNDLARIECGDCGRIFRGIPGETPCPRCGSRDALNPDAAGRRQEG
jgi:hypothetical protein